MLRVIEIKQRYFIAERNGSQRQGISTVTTTNRMRTKVSSHGATFHRFDRFILLMVAAVFISRGNEDRIRGSVIFQPTAENIPEESYSSLVLYEINEATELGHLVLYEADAKNQVAIGAIVGEK